MVRHQFLSLDPYMRGWLSDAKSYAKPQELGTVTSAWSSVHAVDRVARPERGILGSFDDADRASAAARKPR